MKNNECVICGEDTGGTRKTCSQDCLNVLRSRNTTKSNKELGIKAPQNVRWSGARLPRQKQKM